MLSGLIGIGGGMIMVPAMVYFLNMTQHKAQGTSLFVIIPTAFFGAFLYSLYGHLNLEIVIWVSIGGMAGGYLGSFFAGKFSEKTLKITFAVFLLLVGIRMVF